MVGHQRWVSFAPVVNSFAMAESSFHVLIFFQAKPGKSVDLGGILADLVAPSRAEPGCKSYEPFADTQNPDKFVVVEEWETQEQWHAHLRTPHVAEALAKVDAEAILSEPFAAQ